MLKSVLGRGRWVLVVAAVGVGAYLAGSAMAAQDAAGSPSAAAPSTQPSSGSSSSATAGQREAAAQLLTAMKTEQMVRSQLDKTVEAQLQANPGLNQFEDIIRGFLNKYMSFDAMKAELVELYAKEFSEDELRELIKFYESPIGQKLADKQSLLTARGAMIGQRQVQQHLPELQNAIRERVMKLQGGPGGGGMGGGEGGAGGGGLPGGGGGGGAPAEPK
jgi:hypothetical protein